MISGYTGRSSGLHHPHHKPQNLHDYWPAIDKITDKNCLATIGRSDAKIRAVRVNRVSQLLKQRIHFIETSVDVANNVEGPVFVLQVSFGVLSPFDFGLTFNFSLEGGSLAT